jgi:ribonucleoside-diphosphate reductase alpha chain
MLTIDVNHPDILEFIKIKSDLTKVTGANISVKLTDDFMVAVIKGNDFELLWESKNDQKQVKRVVPAKEIWDEIINQAYSTAEPGVLFWDRQHKYSTSSIYPQFKNLTTNPCSEIAMQGGDSCRLMALNLLGFVEHPFTVKSSFNFEKFYEVTYESMRLMDDLVDLEIESIDAILNKIDKDGEPDDVKKTERELWELLRKNGLEGRRTGLGFTGLADALAALGIAYNSDAALEKTDAIMRTKLMGEFDCSIDMAIERGAFKGYDAAIEWESDFVKMMDLDFPDLFERMEKYGRRNVSISTVAPTGSVSILTQTSSGIEPVYQLSYTRKRKVKTENSFTTKDAMGDFWESNEVYHHQLKNWKEVNPNSKIEDSPYFGNTANEIDWNYRLKLQKVIQKYTTHSISSTINLAKETTKDVVSSIYIKAWQLGLKGITVYRDGSRDGVLVSTSKEKKEADKILVKRPQILKADVVRFKNESEDWIAFVGLINENPREIFTGKVGDDLSIPIGVGKGEIFAEITNGVKKYHFNYLDENNNQHSVKEISKAFNPEFWNYAKLISGVLAHSKIEDVITLVEELNLNDQHLNTWKNGVKRVLSRYVKTLEGGNKCVSCGELSIIFEEGCAKCTSCGYQICS